MIISWKHSNGTYNACLFFSFFFWQGEGLVYSKQTLKSAKEDFKLLILSHLPSAGNTGVEQHR